MSSPTSPPRVTTSPTRELTTPTRMIRILGDSPLPAYDQWRLPVGTGGNYGDDSAYVAYGSHIAPWRTPVTDRPRSSGVFGFDCETLLKKAKLMTQQALYFDDLEAQVAAYFYVEIAKVQHQLQQLYERSQRAYEALIAAPVEDDDVIEGDLNEIRYDLKQIAHFNLRNLNDAYRKDVYKSLRAEERDLERQRHHLFNRVLASQKLRKPRPSRIPVKTPPVTSPPSDPQLNKTIRSPSPKITFPPSPPPKSGSKASLADISRPGGRSKAKAQRPVGRQNTGRPGSVQVAAKSSWQQASRPKRPASQPNVGGGRSQRATRPSDPRQQQQPTSSTTLVPSRSYSSTLRRPDGSHLPLYKGHVGGPKQPPPEKQRPLVPLKTKYQRMTKWIKCAEEAARALDEESYLEHHQEQTTSRFEEDDLSSDLVDLHNMLMG